MIVTFTLAVLSLQAQPPATPPVTPPPKTTPAPMPVAQPPVTPPPMPGAQPPATPPMNPMPGAQPPATPPITPGPVPGAQPPAAQPMPVVPAQPPAATPPPAPPAATPPPSWPTVVGGKDLAGWLKELKESPDGAVREIAVKAIPSFGPAARGPALRPLVQHLSRETDPGVKINIVLLLGQIGAEDPKDVKLIVETLNSLLGSTSSGSPFRLHAIRSLTNYGPAATLVMPLLKSHAADPAWETRQAVAMAMGRIGRATDPKKGPNKTALDTLAERLGKEDCAVVRLEIAQSLLLLGPPVYQSNIPGDYERAIKPYFEALNKRLDTETDAATKVWLLMTQMSYDGRAFTDATITKIAEFISGNDVAGRIAALRALALLGEKAKPALPAMIATLKWTEPDLVVEGMIALAALKTLAKDALPELERIKAGQDEYLKQVAASAIEIISGRKNAAPPPAPAPDPKKK